MGRRLLRPLPFHLLAWPLLPQHDRAALIEANDVSSGSVVRQITQSKASNEVWPPPPRTTGVMSGFGTFETCRRTLKRSAYRGRSEVIGSQSERRDWTRSRSRICQRSLTAPLAPFT